MNSQSAPEARADTRARYLHGQEGEGCSGPHQHPGPWAWGYRAGTAPRGSQPQSQGSPAPPRSHTQSIEELYTGKGTEGGARVPLAPQEPGPPLTGTAPYPQCRPITSSRRSSGGCGHRRQGISAEARGAAWTPVSRHPQPQLSQSTPGRHRKHGGRPGRTAFVFPRAAKSALSHLCRAHAVIDRFSPDLLFLRLKAICLAWAWLS